MGLEMIKDILGFAAEKVERGECVALVTVTNITGSSPASIGQMMAVSRDGSTVGTVGGGASEHRIIKQAVDAIRRGDSFFKCSIDHAQEGMTCGGGMVVFGNVLGNNVNLIIFGGGHVAQALARLATEVGFYVTVVEDRAEYAEYFSNARYIHCLPEKYDEFVPMHTTDYAVICTRGHSTDYDALRYCLTKELKYLGMIGSKKKVSELFDRLRSEGFTQEVLNRVYAPIGLDIADNAPAEIAVAILAEILLIKNDGELKHKKTILGKCRK